MDTEPAKSDVAMMSFNAQKVIWANGARSDDLIPVSCRYRNE